MSSDSCENTQIKYSGNGVQKQFTFPFTYINESDVRVGIWNATTQVYDNKEKDDATYGWSLANATTVEFNTAPPMPTPSDLKNIQISRFTDVSPLAAKFYPGSSIRAQDLNDNFDQVAFAIEENRCHVSPEVQGELDERYWSKTETRYNDNAGDDWSTEDISDKNVVSAGAISTRLDNILSDNNPGFQAMGGKMWVDTKSNRLYYYNPDIATFVGLTQKGAAGTIEIGDTTTGEPGTDAEVINIGTPESAILEFTIPRGEQGERGPSGDGIQFRGTIDATTEAQPTDAVPGDLWVNIVAGTVNTVWDDIGDEDIEVNDRIIWNGTEWSIIPTGGNTTVVSSATAPDPAVEDQLWFNTTTNQLYTGVGDPAVWTPTVPVVVQAGEPLDTDFTGELWYSPNDKTLRVYDGSAWVSTNFSVSVSANPPSNPENGDLWYKTTDGRLYIWVEANNQWEVTTPIEDAGIPEAPLDGQQYARQSGAWSVVTGGGGGDGTTINYSGAAAWGLIDMNAQLLAGMNCKVASSADGFGFRVTFDNPMPSANYAITACAATRVGIISDVAWTDNDPDGFTLYVKDQTGSAVQAGVSFAVHATNALPPRGGTGADAWVSCKADGTVEASFNIASVTKSATGKYDLVFTTPMPTADYAITTAAGFGSSASVFVISKTTTGCQIGVFSDITQAYLDMDFNAVVHATNAQLPDTVTQEQIDAILANSSVSAWVLGNGDGTTQSSLNIASVTRTGLGLYDVTFATPMPSADYSVQCTVAQDTFSVVAYNTARTTNGFSIKIANSNDQRFDLDFSATVHATNSLPPKGGTGADAWALVNAPGTLYSSFNIDSVTRTGLGNYDITFTNPMPNNLYAVSATGVNTGAVIIASVDTQRTDGFSVYIRTDAGIALDSTFSIVVHATNAQLPETITMQMWDDLVARVTALENN